MAVEMSQYLAVGDRPGDGSAVFVHEDGGNAHDIAARARGVSGLDGVANRAGDSLVFKGPLLGHALRQVAAEQRDRVVAALAVAGVLHTLLIDEQVYVLEIPGSTETIGVNGLAPLAVRLLMAVTAILGSGEALGARELPSTCCGIRGKKRRVFAECVIVASSDGIMEWGCWAGYSGGDGIGRGGGRSGGRGGICGGCRGRFRASGGASGLCGRQPGDREEQEGQGQAQETAGQHLFDSLERGLEHGQVISREEAVPQRRTAGMSQEQIDPNRHEG